MNPVVVIGSGMSGAAVAGNLRRREIPFVVADLGPNCGSAHVGADAATRAQIDPYHDPSFRPLCRDPAAKHYGAGAGTRLRVGGRSLYWRGIALELEDYALADWPPEVARAVRASYPAVEARLAAWTGRPLDAPRNELERSLVERLRGLGFANAMPTPRAVQVGLAGEPWAAYSPLSEIRADDVLAGRALVDLSPERDGLVVRFDAAGREETMRAAAVVLCAGAIENARLVSRLLGRAGPFPLVDHLAQGWVCVPPSETAPPGRAEASLLLHRDQTARFNGFVELHRSDGMALFDAWTMGELLLGEAASLRFDASGPRIDVPALPEAGDVLEGGRRFLRDLCARLGWTLAADWSDCDDDFAGALVRARAAPGRAVPYRCPLGTVDHEGGTLALGSECVGASSELRELPGVFVAGPCLFPRAGAANPSLTTLALGAYVAGQVEARTTR